MIRLLMGAALGAALAGSAWAAEKSAVGPMVCADCHASEHAVWEATPHALSFKTVHKAEKAKDILAAAGGDANIRKNAVCSQCHFTMVAGDDGAAAAKAGPSCETCHGGASDWLKVHNAVKPGEAASAREKRLEGAAHAGMVRPGMLYDLSAQCASCHGLARPGVDPEVMAKMVAAGHPFDPSFEMVRFSQGSLRHRFGGKDKSVNRERDLAELARLYVAGQAAKAVSAKAALAKGGPAAYQDLQKKRLADAQKALEAAKSAPEAAALSADPSEDKARKLVDAVAGKDLSAELKDLLPAKADYK